MTHEPKKTQKERKSDKEYRQRLLDAYGMWGAVCTEIIESEGSALDDIASALALPKRRSR